MAVYYAEEFHQKWAETFNAGVPDAILALYEKEAVLVAQPGQTVTGITAIGQALDWFLGLNGKIHLQPKLVVKGAGVALLVSAWTLNGKDSEGNPVELGGETSDVIRQQPDGHWLVAIDNPYGSFAA